jgi:hypothetical protein
VHIRARPSVFGGRSPSRFWDFAEAIRRTETPGRLMFDLPPQTPADEGDGGAHSRQVERAQRSLIAGAFLPPVVEPYCGGSPRWAKTAAPMMNIKLGTASVDAVFANEPVVNPGGSASAWAKTITVIDDISNITGPVDNLCYGVKEQKFESVIECNFDVIVGHEPLAVRASKFGTTVTFKVVRRTVVGGLEVSFQNFERAIVAQGPWLGHRR